jgi:hypothetical protein
VNRAGKVMRRMLWTPWRDAAYALLDATDRLLADRRRPLATAAVLLLCTLGAFVVYVPIHELLHALGGVATGGTVEEIEIARLYGGGLLERVLPVVRAGGPYAGRLSRFDTHGSDLTYLATDVAPFVLTILGAFPLLRLASARRSVAAFAAGAVLLAAPAISLPGDFYEMGSIVVSAGLRLVPGAATDEALGALRHDDLVGLVADFGARFPQDRLFWAAAVTVAALVGWLLAGMTLAASRAVGMPRGRAPRTAPGAPTSPRAD